VGAGVGSVGTMPNIGPTELIVVLVLALVIFGPKRLPSAGRALGESLRGFKDSINGRSVQHDELAGGETPAARPE
jgi:sec-independent protein translocase protein TatA